MWTILPIDSTSLYAGKNAEMECRPTFTRAPFCTTKVVYIFSGLLPYHEIYSIKMILWKPAFRPVPFRNLNGRKRKGRLSAVELSGIL